MLGFDSLRVPPQPLVANFAIVPSVLHAISALAAARAIRKGTTPRWAWALPMAVVKTAADPRERRVGDDR